MHTVAEPGKLEKGAESSLLEIGRDGVELPSLSINTNITDSRRTSMHAFSFSNWFPTSFKDFSDSSSFLYETEFSTLSMKLLLTHEVFLVMCYFLFLAL